MISLSDKKIATVVLIIVAVVLASAFGVFLLVKNFSKPVSQPPLNWNTYQNQKYGFSFSYPKDWLIWEWATPEVGVDGRIISLRSPETERLFQERQIYPGASYNLTVSFWSSINNIYAQSGGSETGYKNLTEYFADKKIFKSKEKIGTLIVAGQKAYEVLIGGAGIIYGVMIEHNGVYQLSFETAWDKSQLGYVEKQILSTFRFLK